jgi:hypothetical protein
MRIPRVTLALSILAFVTAFCADLRAQAALLLQDANGAAEVLSPLGHESVYFARICAASPIKLRRCTPGELGVVIARYSGIGSYDWLAMPLIPYLYSVEDVSQTPSHVNRETVQSLRLKYHDAHLMSLGSVPEGNEVHKGWNQLVGAAYERRIWAFRFETTEAQDDAFIAKMNAEENRSRYSMVFRNCANFSGTVLNFYFPQTFRRHILPDGGIVTPRQVAYELVQYRHEHPEIQLTVTEIPLVPGYHHSSRVGKSAAESFIATGYIVPIALVSPYAAGAILIDAFAWGRCPLPLKNAEVLSPESIALLADSSTKRTAEKDGPGRRDDAASAVNLSPVQRSEAKTDSLTNATLLQKHQ